MCPTSRRYYYHLYSSLKTMHIMEKTINKGFATKAQAQMQLEAADAANRMHMQGVGTGREGDIKDKTTHGHCCICLTYIDNGGAMSMYAPLSPNSDPQTKEWKTLPANVAFSILAAVTGCSREKLRRLEDTLCTCKEAFTFSISASLSINCGSPFSTLQGRKLAAMMSTVSTVSIFSPWHAPYLLAPLFMQCALPQ